MGAQRRKVRLVEAITDDVIKILNVDKKDVIIVFHEEPHGNWYAKVLDSDLTYLASSRILIMRLITLNSF